MAKKGKSKSIGFFGAIGSLLGCIPAVRNVKKAIGKAFKKKIKKAKNKLKLKNLFKKLKKNFKKKRGKVFTKARKLKNKLSKRKLSKMFKKAVKKAVLAQKKADKRATTKGGKASKAAVKQVKKYEKAQNLKLVSMGLNCVPIFGNIKALYEMGTGKDLITGQTKQTGKKIIDEAELEKYLKDRQSVSNRNRNSVNAGEPITTLEDLRKVLSAPSTVNPDGLAPYAVIGANIAYALVLEDLVKYGNPNSTFREQNEALLSLLSPFGKAGKAKKGVETLEDLEKGLEAAYDLANKTKKVKEVQHTQKEIEQLEEYLKKIDKGTDKVPGMPPIVQSRINISNDGWKHVQDRHFSNKNASQFTISQDELRTLLSNKEIVNSPVTRSIDSADGPRYVREITLDTPIGLDKFNDFKPTSTMTILVDSRGNLVTVTPGVIK